MVRERAEWARTLQTQATLMSMATMQAGSQRAADFGRRQAERFDEMARALLQTPPDEDIPLATDTHDDLLSFLLEDPWFHMPAATPPPDILAQMIADAGPA